MFGFNIDRKFIYILLGALVLMSLMSYSSFDLMALLLTLPAVIIAITFHEYAHAYAADKLGDDTPRMQGRLNLNPLSHLDPVGFMLLMFAGFGWGKPVQINPRNFNRNVRMDKGEAIVSVAGPLMNFILAIVSAIILGAIYMFAPASFLMNTVGNIIYILLQELVIINIGLGVFNLIPLPPLDGSKIFRNFMSYKVKAWLDKNERYFYFAFLILWVTGLAGQVISPIITWITMGLFNGLGLLF